MEAMRVRLEEIESETEEISVGGGYMQYFEDESDVRRPFSPNEAKVIARLTHRESIAKHLHSLSDQDLMGKYRYIQYRLLEDGSLWYVYGMAHLKLEVGGWIAISESEVVPFAQSQP